MPTAEHRRELDKGVCDGKLTFRSPDEADKAARGQSHRRRTGRKRRARQRSYKCHVCGRWHLTSLLKRFG